jgi:hypothetical protein
MHAQEDVKDPNKPDLQSLLSSVNCCLMESCVSSRCKENDRFTHTLTTHAVRAVSKEMVNEKNRNEKEKKSNN